MQIKLLLYGNQTDMQLAFLGTAAFKPYTGRALGSVALLRGKDVWLFDTGKHTSRSLLPHLLCTALFLGRSVGSVVQGIKAIWGMQFRSQSQVLILVQL